MQHDQQKAQDIIWAVEMQRNKALAELAFAQADLAAAKRHITQLEEKVKELSEALAKQQDT